MTPTWRSAQPTFHGPGPDRPVMMYTQIGLVSMKLLSPVRTKFSLV